MANRALWVCFAGALLFTACGGNVVTGSGGSATTGPASTSGSTSGTGATGATSSTVASIDATVSSTVSTTSSSGGGFAMPCGPGLTCCGSTCVNAQNDILNCGACGTTCPGPNPYCHMGVCET